MYKYRFQIITIISILLIMGCWGCERSAEQEIGEEYALVAQVEGQGKVIKVPDEPLHAVGSIVNLSTAPAEGWEFSHWLQDEIIFTEALESEIEIEVMEEKVFTAVFLPATEILKVEVEGEGNVEEHLQVDEITSSGEEKLPVELVAVPEQGWVFAGWLGDVKNSERRKDRVVVNRMSKGEIKAVFVSGDYSLSLGIEGSGEVKIKEIRQGDEILKNYSRLSGFTVETWVQEDLEDLLLAGSILELTGMAAEGWGFAGWSGDATDSSNPLQMEINKDLSITAHFEEVTEYNLEINKEGNGRVDIEVVDYPLSDQEYYPVLPEGAEVEIRAVPDAGWGFVSWSGDVSETDKENSVLNFVIEEDLSITANFEQEQYAITVSVEGQGIVEEKIIELPSGYEDLATIYPPGTIIELAAQPAGGWRFEHWLGDVETGSENNNPLLLTVKDDISLTAVFTESESSDGQAQLNGSISISHSWPYSSTFSGAEITAAEYKVAEKEIEVVAEEKEFVEGEMIVVFSPVTLLSDREKLLQESSLQILAVQPALNAYLVKTGEVSTQSALDSIMSVSGVSYAEPNYLFRIQEIIPDDVGFDYQWHYPLIRLPQAWEVTKGSPNVRVGVLDTGIDDNHPDLGVNIAVDDGFSFPDSNQNYMDNHGHGTHVAGTIGANTGNQEGVAGIMWQAEIVPIKVLDDEGYGSNWDICQGILYAAGLTEDPVISTPVDVINMSLGGSENSEYMEESVQEAYNAGLLMVAAAGNSDTSLPMYPASYPEVISVGSVELNYPDEPVRAPYSCYGETLDVMAPGGNTRVDTDDSGFADGVLSTTFNDDSGTRDYNYVYYQGTSMASPHATGLVGLLLADGVPSDQVRDILRTTAFDLGAEGFDEEFGYGLINAYWAVSRLDSIRILVGLRDGDAINSVLETSVGIQDREFNLENIPTGSYRVYAWIDVLGNNRLDPGDYLAESELIDFVDSESYNQSLELTELE